MKRCSPPTASTASWISRTTCWFRCACAEMRIPDLASSVAELKRTSPGGGNGHTPHLRRDC
eukprot:9259954-Prorocentrum_lima.AAC.1